VLPSKTKVWGERLEGAALQTTCRLLKKAGENFNFCGGGFGGCLRGKGLVGRVHAYPLFRKEKVQPCGEEAGATPDIQGKEDGRFETGTNFVHSITAIGETLKFSPAFYKRR